MAQKRDSVEIPDSAPRKGFLYGRRKYQFSFLLISLILMIAILPSFTAGPSERPFASIFLTFILLSGIYAISGKRVHLYVALIFAVPAIITSWVATLSYNFAVYAISTMFIIAFIALIVIIVLSTILRSEEITRDTLMGAVCGYLLIGILWGTMYLFFEVIHPGSFFIDPIHNPDGITDFGDLIYYSFITLTTLGYGDITPIAPQVRSLAMFEAVSGVLYLAVLIARLVGSLSPGISRERKTR
jgi:hypothetical protein